MEKAQNYFERGWDILTSNWIFLALFNLIIIIVILFLLYKYVFSGKGIWIREKFSFLKKVSVQKDVGQYIKDGEYAKAGDLLISQHRYKDAVKVFMDGNIYGRAADVYLLKKQYDQAANLYEQAGDFEKAAELYVQLKDFERAEKCLLNINKAKEIPNIYLKNNLKSLAAQSMVKLGQYREAAKLFAEEKNYIKASEMILEFYEKSKNSHESSEFYMEESKLKKLIKSGGEYMVKAKKYGAAAELFMEEKLYNEAAECFELEGKHEKAVECYIKVDNHKKAAALLRKNGDNKKAAFIEAEGFAQEGDDNNAVKYYQEAGDFAKAGDIYRNIQEFEKAGIMFEKAKEYSLAASSYANGKLFDRAAICSEKIKEYDQAIEYYGKAGDYARQVTLQEKLGKYLGAGQNYYKRGLIDESLKILEKIKETDTDHNQALALIGKIYMERGDITKAKEKLEMAISSVDEISKSNIDTFTNLALLAEKSDSESGVLKTIEKMLSDDLVDPEIKGKVDDLKQKLNYFAISRLSKIATKDGGKFAEPEINVSQVAKMEKKRYVKVKEIGRGGMGIVYTAKDTTLDRIVALKILPSILKKNPQAVKTFLREAKSAAALNHPNIVTVFDAGVEDADYYIAMELINGLTIKEILRKSKKLSVSSVLEVLRQLLNGLKYAHRKNIVHRDLTTNNIMWSKEKVVKIMDFGLAKVVRQLQSEQSIIGGTPSFMSPEQTLGKPIDHRTDLYSLGICLFQMLLGELPFKKGDLGYHHVHTTPPEPKSIDKSIPETLNEMIVKCMKKKPEERYQSSEEIQDLIDINLSGYKR